MAASIENRVPLLDHKLVEFAASLPSRLKLNGLTRKYLLKKVSSAWLPAEIINRKKQGFPMPVSLWFRNEARDFMRDLLAPDTINRRGLFSADYVQKIICDHESGFADNGSLIWALINVELWQRQFLDAPRMAEPRLQPAYGFLARSHA
jgi:asparagine synthase (glutamine-hydrolysing)